MYVATGSRNDASAARNGRLAVQTLSVSKAERQGPFPLHLTITMEATRKPITYIQSNILFICKFQTCPLFSSITERRSDFA